MASYEPQEEPLSIGRKLASVQASLPLFQQLIKNLGGYCKEHRHSQTRQDYSNIELAFQNLSHLVNESMHSTYSATLNEEACSHLRHDMRASLGGIKGYAELILDTLTDLGASPLRDLLTELLKAVDDRLPLIDHIRASPSTKDKPLFNPAPASCAEGPLQEGDILIVDDSPQKHELIRRRLSHTSYHILSALSGTEALEIIPSLKPDLILLDLLMPGMSGFEVLNILKSTPQTADIPVLVISSSNEVDNVVQCLRAGAEDYLPMPLNPVILLTRVNSCMQKKALRDREMRYISELDESRLRLEKAIQSIDEGFAIFDNKEKVVMTNQNFKDFYELPPLFLQNAFSYEEFLRHYLAQGFYRIKTEGAKISLALPSFQQREKWVQGQLEFFRKDNSSHLQPFASGKWLEIITNRIPGGGTVYLHKDVTHRIKEERRIKHLATHDTLTGLANRLFFEKEATLQFKKASLKHQTVFLMFFDLDGFKSINDNLGHDFGDHVLKSVASHLSSALRQNDLVARLGGDEFCAMLPNLSITEVVNLAKRCLKAIGTTVKNQEKVAHFGVSIGIACYPLHGKTVPQVLKSADKAMYQAKHEGKGRYVVAETLS